MPQPSPYWGDEPIWNSKANVHNPMFDDKGRVWITATVRPPENPDFCKEGSDHPSAKLFPVEKAYRHLGFYDPKTKKYTHISTCFSTHHLMFAEDENNTLWTSGGGEVIGWLDTKKYEETGDEEASQGWTALILDTNGNGKRDKYVEPNEPVNPKMDKRIAKGSICRFSCGRWFGMGIFIGISRSFDPARSGIKSTGNGTGGILRTTIE